MMLFGNPLGHDFDLHVPSWMETAQQFHQGNLFPWLGCRSKLWLWRAALYFYPPLSRMIGGTLGLILPWAMVPGAYVWLVLVLAGMAMWKCASQWLDPSTALMASLVYAVSPYLIVTAYTRCNYAELLAMALFPLLVWAGIQIGRDARTMVLPLSIVLAAIWLSDLPAAVIATYCLALLLALMSFAQRSLRPMLYGALAMMGTFGSIAFFLIPAASERKWVSIAEAVRPDLSPDANFIFSRYATLLSFNRRLSFIALLLIAAAACTAIVTRRCDLKLRTWYSLVALGAASAFMMVPPSLIFYRFLTRNALHRIPVALAFTMLVVVLLISFSIAGEAADS